MWAVSFLLRVLAPAANSGQCRFNVTIWIEQSFLKTMANSQCTNCISVFFLPNSQLNRKLKSGPLALSFHLRQNATNPAKETDQTGDSALAWQRADRRKHAWEMKEEEPRQRTISRKSDAACVQLKAPSLHLPGEHAIQRLWQMPGTRSIKCHISAYAFRQHS